MARNLSISLALLALVFLGIRSYEQVMAKRSATTPTPAVAVPTTSTPVVAAPSAAAGPTVLATRAAPQVIPIRVEISEQEVNRLLKEGLVTSGYQVDDLNVRLEEGQFVATTTQQVAFLRIPVTLTGNVGVADGKVTMTPTSVQAAGATLPQSLIDQLVGSFRSQLAQGIESLPIRIDSIEIHRGSVVVQGTPK